MVLEYKFKYLSNNNTLIKFLKAILSNENKEKLDFQIFREGDFIYLYVKAEEQELLEISDKLSVKLPMSIFLKDYSLEVVNEMPNKEQIHVDDEFNLAFCPNCIENVENKESKDYYNPFFKCNICASNSTENKLILFEKEIKKEFVNNKELFEFVSLKLNEGKRVKIKTKIGTFVYYKTDILKSKDEKVICTNINSISKLTVASKTKTVALLSIEKPSIDFNLNASYKSKNKLDFETVNIRYAYDLTLYLLSLELQSLELDFLSYEISDEYDYELTYENSDEVETLHTPYIAINDDRFLFIENKNYDKKLDEIYNKFKDKSKSQFMVLIEENNLYEKSVLNIFNSSLHNDNISLYSKKIDGIIDILNYNIPTSISEIFDEIEQSDSGKRLLKNYKEKFPENYEAAMNFEIIKNEKNSMLTLWSIVAVVLGFKRENINNSFQSIVLENAQEALLQKGPRVDYKLKPNEKIFNKEFDISKFLRSGMSFKLAGVDDKTLSFGYLESYVYFLVNIIDETNEEFVLDGVSLCGDLIANELFLKLVKKTITSKFDLYYNKDFPIQL